MASEDEEALRQIAVADLRRWFPTARIIHEIPLEQMTCRLDLAAVTDDHICLVEIKSKKDTTKRLPEQIKFAERITGDIVIYSDIKHQHAIESMENYWRYPRRYYRDGVLQQHQFDQHDRMRFLKMHSNGRMCTRRLLRLLWRDELIALRRVWNLADKTTRADIIEDLVEHLTGRQVRQAVCAALRRRQFARADDPVAVAQGLEPQSSGPKPDVIPLDQATML